MASKKPWPTKDAMEQVYENKLWGSNDTPFYSGEGSHKDSIVKPYVSAVQVFLKSFKTKLVVCDLGCGDFNVGKHFVKYTAQYFAVDIVEELITYNKEQFKDEKLQFICLDIAKEPLPKADCVIIRQVLQHLSNAEINAIVQKLPQYKYIILTEHIPENEFEANKDIISGQGIRLKKQSGVVLTSSPFNLKVKNEKCMLITNSEAFKGKIVTTLYGLDLST